MDYRCSGIKTCLLLAYDDTQTKENHYDFLNSFPWQEHHRVS